MGRRECSTYFPSTTALIWDLELSACVICQEDRFGFLAEREEENKLGFFRAGSWGLDVNCDAGPVFRAPLLCVLNGVVKGGPLHGAER